MARPPADADPEKFIIGRGAYDNLQTARPYCDEHVFRIDPAPMPVWSIVIYNLVFAAFFYGFHWLIKHGSHAAEPWMVYGIPIGVGIATCGAFTAMVYYSFDHARRHGPWLIYDKVTSRVELPRDGASFERSEIVQLQFVTTKRLDWGGVLNNERHSELNLITCREGVRQRWPLLRSIFQDGAFDRVLIPLMQNTDLPVMRVKDQWLGWQITETPYGKV